MEKVIITGYTAKSEGVILETNVPARLKPNRMPSKETFVSWDKIGSLLFENYSDESEPPKLTKLRDVEMEKEFISKWVSVNERTPTNIDEVVIMDADHYNYLGIGSYSSENGWAIQGSFYWKPTHWLELLPTNKIE